MGERGARPIRLTPPTERRRSRWPLRPGAVVTRRTALALLAGALAAGVGVATVLAHVNLVGTTPRPDEVVSDSPGEVAVWFDGAILASGSGISLLDRGGAVLARSDGIAPGTRDRLALSPPPLTPGSYTVVWQYAASDGHSDKGFYPFSVGAADPPLALTVAPDRQRVGSAEVALSAVPADDTRQRFEAVVLDARGAPLADVQRVQLRFRLQPFGAVSLVTLAPQGEGRYLANTTLPSAAGRYDAEVQVRLRRADDLLARFTVEAALPAAPTPTATPAASPTARATPTPG